MTVDTERFRALLEEERKRVVDAIEYLHKENPGSIEYETEDETTDDHIAETATATLDREIDYTLEENSEQVLSEIDDALRPARSRRAQSPNASTYARKQPESGRFSDRPSRSSTSRTVETRVSRPPERGLDFARGRRCRPVS